MANHGRYLSAWGDRRVHCDKDHCDGTEERWELLLVSGSSDVVLRNVCSTKLMCPTSDDKLMADHRHIDDSTRWQMERNGGHSVSFRNNSIKKYLSMPADQNGRCARMMPWCEVEEQFDVNPITWAASDDPALQVVKTFFTVAEVVGPLLL